MHDKEHIFLAGRGAKLFREYYYAKDRQNVNLPAVYSERKQCTESKK